MTVSAGAIYDRPLHPVNAVLVAGATPLFIGALLSDLAYGKTYHPQWANFASWLIIGAMVLTGFALLGALLRLLTRAGRARQGLLLTALLAVTFVVGFIDALQHARDAWAIMPAATILSAIVALTSLAATVVGFSYPRAGA